MSWKEAKDQALAEFERRLQQEGVECPKCGSRNLSSDPLCRTCFRVLRPGLVVLIAAAVILVCLIPILWSNG